MKRKSILLIPGLHFFRKYPNWTSRALRKRLCTFKIHYHLKKLDNLLFLRLPWGLTPLYSVQSFQDISWFLIHSLRVFFFTDLHGSPSAKAQGLRTHSSSQERYRKPWLTETKLPNREDIREFTRQGQGGSEKL